MFQQSDQTPGTISHFGDFFTGEPPQFQTNQIMKLKTLFPIIAMLLIGAAISCKNDDNEPGVRPTVTATNPVSGATNVPTSQLISVTFGVEMKTSSFNEETFVLTNSSGLVNGSVAQAGVASTFTPATALLPNTQYTATISGEVADLDGNELGQDYSWSFTTGANPDLLAPTVVSSIPENGAEDVVLNQLVQITFSEPMNPASLISAFTLKAGTTTIDGVVTTTDSSAVFTPSADLEPNQVYTASVAASAADMSGNSLAAAFTLEFTTGDALDISLPQLSAFYPLHEAEDVAVDTLITVTFDELMDPASISTSTFMVMDGTSVVTGNVALAGLVATFTPATVLEYETTYTVTVTTGVQDLAGNAMAANVEWVFTTMAFGGTLPVVNLGSSANYVILAKTAISNVPTSAITGDLGLSPAATSFITGFGLTDATGYATAPEVTGKIYAADMAAPTSTNLTTAVSNMEAAFSNAAGRSNPDFLELGAGSIGGLTLEPGLYKWTSTVLANSNVTLSGTSTDVWIFQISGDLTIATGVRINLGGQAQAKNIFWQVSGVATMGTTSHMEGTILAATDITFQTGASMNGRALSQTQVVLDGNVITQPQ